MSRQFLITLLVGVAVIGAGLYTTVRVNKAHLLTLTGTIDNVRAVSLTPEATLVIVDFTATNPSAVPFELRELELERVEGDKVTPSGRLNRSEIENFFDYYKLPRRGAVFGLGDKVGPGEKVQRMIAARFELLPEGLEKATYRIRFHHYDNVTAEIMGKKP